MKLWSTIHKCYVETIGIISGCEILCVTEDGRWIHGHPDNLIKDRPKEDVAKNMEITVKHIVDNPTFPFDSMIEITKTDDDGTVHTLWDDREKDYWHEIPEELLCKKITYMVVNTSTGVLRLEVG